MTDPQPFDASPQLPFNIGAGDLEPALMVTCYWSDGSLVDFTDAGAVTFSMWENPRSSPVIDHATATIVNASHGIVKYVWGGDDTAEPGTYYGRFFADMGGGRDASWPDNTYLKIVISAAGAAAETPPPDDVAQGLLQPGGEVGGTWAHMTVNAVHSGSSHAQIAAAAAGALDAHRGVGVDQHSVYARADGGRGMFARAVNFDDEMFTGSDQERLDAAIAYAAGLGGSTLVVPPGTYRVANVPPVPLVEIAGSGKGVTIFKLPDDAATGDRVVKADAVTAVDGFAMRDLTIDGNKDQWGQDDDIDTGCVDLTAAPGLLTNVRLTNVEIVGGQSVGFALGDAPGSRLDNVVSHDNGWSSGSGANINAVGIHITSTDVLLHGCRAYTNASHGFLIDGTTVLTSLVICEAHANSGDGIHVAGTTAMCRLVACVSRQNAGTGIHVEGASYPKVEAAISETNGAGGVLFDGVTAGMLVGSTVKANEQSSTGTDEVRLTGTTTGCVVTGNVIVPTLALTAIREASSADSGNEISGNRLTAGVSGLVSLYSAAVLSGAGSPSGVVAAGVGSTWRRTNGGTNTSFWVKESGPAATSGWVAK